MRSGFVNGWRAATFAAVRGARLVLCGVVVSPQRDLELQCGGPPPLEIGAAEICDIADRDRDAG